MSVNNPGAIFDASCSWNGYNHQGKLALWFALKEIERLYDTKKTIDENVLLLDTYFLEIEYLEDFSIGKKLSDGSNEYLTVHQVKNHDKTAASEYNSALLGLACHINDMPNLQNAYLHTTKAINLQNKSLLEYLKELISEPINLQKLLGEINKVRSDDGAKEKLTQTGKRERPNIFIRKLKEAYAETLPEGTKIIIDKNNLDNALDALENKINKQILICSSMSDAQLSKIKLYPYCIDSTIQLFCKVNQIEQLLKNQIEKLTKLLPVSKVYWSTTTHINKRYVFLLGKLDQHIIDRNLNFPLYKSGLMNRKISLKTIYQWITDEAIDDTSDEFYVYHIKEAFFSEINKYCMDKCCKDDDECSVCAVHSCVNKIGSMRFKEMCDFLHLTNPTVNEKLSMNTYRYYAGANGIKNPFIKGLRDISYIFDENKTAITYKDEDTFQYVLTTLLSDDSGDDAPDICSDILKNSDLYELMMDCDCFISRDLDVNSIPKEALKCGKQYDERDAEHIARFKNVKIESLVHFIGRVAEDN